MRSTRTISLEILNKIESRDAYADILLEEAFRRYLFKDVDKGLLTELVYGILRWKNRIDWIIGLFSSVKPARMERDILNILRLGTYQLLFLDRIPVSAAVNESVKLAKVRGQRQGSFVNAVLRAIDRGRNEITYPDLSTDPLRHISIKYSHPEWLVMRFIQELGIDGAIRLCKANNEPPPLAIRVNSMYISREGLLLRLSEAGYDASFTSLSPAGLILKGAGDVVSIPGFKEGLFTVQDEASQLISLILDPQPGEKVLDACAAPGGKATNIAELMADTGEVVALDIKPQGVRRIEENLRRLGLKSVKTKVFDAAKPLGFTVKTSPFPQGMGDGGMGPGFKIFIGAEGVEDSRCRFREGEFDRILLDAPCSGTGVLRRHPEGKWQKREEDIPVLAMRQRTLMENVSMYLKPEGTMVYSVCSVIKDEGEGVVDAFLASHPEFIMEPAVPQIGDAGEGLICNRGFFKVYSHLHGMDGFFAAKLKKIGNRQ